MLYRLPEVLRAVRAGKTVHITEGEKDADAIVEAGGVATCNPGGAGKWRDEYASPLAGAQSVKVWADKDLSDRRFLLQSCRLFMSEVGLIPIGWG